MEKSISIRQLSIMGFIMTSSLKITVLPSLFFKEVSVNSILVIIILAFIDILSLLAIYSLLKRNQNSSFYEFLSKSVGRILAKLVLFLMFLFYFFKMLFLSEGGDRYAREVIFQEVPFILFLFILLTLAGSLYLFKLNSFSRTLEFFYPIILILFLLFIAIPPLTVDLYDIRPLFDVPATDFFILVFKYLIVSGNYVFMLLFMGRVKFQKNKSNAKPVFIRTILAEIILITFYFIFSSIFRYTGYLHPNAISEIVQFLPATNMLGNFDWLAISFMLLLFLFHGGVFTYAMCDSLIGVIKYKKFDENKNRKWVLLAVYAFLLIILYFVLNTFERLLAFGTEYLSYITVVVIFIPFIILVIDLIKNRRKNEKNT